MNRRIQRSVDTWVFDLDNTLYPGSTGLSRRMDERMRTYIANFLEIDQDRAFALQKAYFRDYATSLRGLINNYRMDPAPFLAYVHDVDLSMLVCDNALEQALKWLPGRKLIFTNASAAHAERVLEHLGIRRHFEGIFDVVTTGYRPKPMLESYYALLDRFTIDPCASVMVEDVAQNLVPAARLGMTTVWIRNDTEYGCWGADGDHVHHSIDNLAAWLQAVTAVLTGDVDTLVVATD